MKFKPTSGASPGWLALFCLLPVFISTAAQAKDLKFDAMLVWATNAEKSPDHKPVPPEVLKKLKDLPLKWKYFYAVTNVGFSLPESGSREVTMSQDCKIEVKHLQGHRFEVSQTGKGVPVLKMAQRIAKGEMLVLGGNAPDETGWLVVLKRIE